MISFLDRKAGYILAMTHFWDLSRVKCYFSNMCNPEFEPYDESGVI